MLKITIPAAELFDGVGSFIYTQKQTLQLEHSLVSLSKWESKWHKPYLSNKKKTLAEAQDYVRCMTLTQNVDPNVYLAVTPYLLQQVDAYINDAMTATTFHNMRKRGGQQEIITAEIIYYLMTFYNIPFECQKWHLNRLLTLINVCAVNSHKPEKMSASELREQHRKINAANRKKYNTRG